MPFEGGNGHGGCVEITTGLCTRGEADWRIHGKSCLSPLNGVAGVGHHDGACVPGFENGGGVIPLVFLATYVSGHLCFWPLGESDFLTLRCRAVKAFRAGNHWSCSLGLPYFANKRPCSDIISFCVMF